MGEDSFKNMLFGFILIGLFGMLVLTAVVNLSDTYSKDTSEVVGGSLALNKFNDSISDVQQSAENLENAFSKQSIWSAIAGVVVEGAFLIFKGMKAMIIAPLTLITNIMADVLHIPIFVTSIIIGIVILSIIFGLWRLVKIGD